MSDLPDMRMKLDSTGLYTWVKQAGYTKWVLFQHKTIDEVIEWCRRR